MARGLNKVMLIGNLGRDPELKYTPKGTAVCKFSLAASEPYKDDNDNWVERTEWVNVTAWRKLAETCGQYLKKGSKIYVEGKLSTRSYEQDGVKKYITEVVLSSMIMLDRKEGGEASESADTAKEESSEDDLPF